MSKPRAKAGRKPSPGLTPSVLVDAKSRLQAATAAPQAPHVELLFAAAASATAQVARAMRKSAASVLRYQGTTVLCACSQAREDLAGRRKDCGASGDKHSARAAMR